MGAVWPSKPTYFLSSLSQKGLTHPCLKQILAELLLTVKSRVCGSRLALYSAVSGPGSSALLPCCLWPQFLGPKWLLQFGSLGSHSSQQEGKRRRACFCLLRVLPGSCINHFTPISLARTWLDGHSKLKKRLEMKTSILGGIT